MFYFHIKAKNIVSVVSRAKLKVHFAQIKMNNLTFISSVWFLNG